MYWICSPALGQPFLLKADTFDEAKEMASKICGKGKIAAIAVTTGEMLSGVSLNISGNVTWHAFR